MPPIVSTTAERADDAPAVLPRGLDSLMITKATQAQVPYLRRLKENVMADRYRPAPDEAGFASWREVYCTDEYFSKIITDPNSMLLSIGTLRDPVGMVVLRRDPDGEHLEIDDLLVTSPRQGDGSRLLVAALRYADVWRVKDVHIDVYPGHAGAEEFLIEHGFHMARETSNDLGRPMLRYERAID